MLLGGDAGVGKSRLITELATQAKAAQWRVLVGHCLDFGESALSYLAFSEALGRLALDEAAMAASLVESNPAIFSLLPSHRMLTETPDRERTMDRVSLLEAIHSTLTQLGRDAPLMLVVEDLHWADRSTRELLTFLFTRGFASQVTIVASYRSDDLHRAHPLRSTLTTWARIAGVTRLQVSPLEDPQMRLLIESLNPSALPEAETQKLLDRAEGNPFYLEELLAAVQSGGSQLPSDLADLMLLRLDQLDDAARLVVRAAAVVGRRSAHRLLARAPDSTERCWIGPCATRSRPTSSWLLTAYTTPSVTPSSPKPCTRIYCQESERGCMRPVLALSRRGRSWGPRPSWPGMHWRLTTW